MLPLVVTLSSRVVLALVVALPLEVSLSLVLMMSSAVTLVVVLGGDFDVGTGWSTLDSQVGRFPVHLCIGRSAPKPFNDLVLRLTSLCFKVTRYCSFIALFSTSMVPEEMLLGKFAGFSLNCQENHMHGCLTT
ncbi:hypothetical protein GGR57DRAFT_475242 [Xylariaceae sp. FL1272]|nr:hypothetical protein GGR57DRAFT_475242 [Xylariaceae sp. FL1272]